MTDEVVPLSPAEAELLAECETVITNNLRGFVDVGNALAMIRDRKLYRQTHATFAAYVKDRFGIQAAYGYRQVEAAQVVAALSPIGDKITNEAQARELVPLLGNPRKMRAVVEWAEAEGPITAASLRRARRVTALSPSAHPAQDKDRDALRMLDELYEVAHHAARTIDLAIGSDVASGEVREVIEGLATQLRLMVSTCDLLLSEGGLTDEALDRLVDGGAP